MSQDPALTAPARPKVPTGQELYDSIMGHIEPDLTSDGVKTLDDKYQNETPEDFAARKQRYILAFERYDQAYEGYLATLQTQVDRYRRASFQHVELVDRNEEQGLLQGLTNAMLSHPV